MDSTKTSINEKTKTVIKDFIKDFRHKGMSTLANMSEDEQTNIVNWAQDVVDQYGSLLQGYSSKIKNIADLPCPREDLKIAIKVLLPAYLSERIR